MQRAVHRSLLWRRESEQRPPQLGQFSTVGTATTDPSKLDETRALPVVLQLEVGTPFRHIRAGRAGQGVVQPGGVQRSIARKAERRPIADGGPHQFVAPRFQVGARYFTAALAACSISRATCCGREMKGT
jgi:hypothetical protein